MLEQVRKVKVLNKTGSGRRLVYASGAHISVGPHEKIEVEIGPGIEVKSSAEYRALIESGKEMNTSFLVYDEMVFEITEIVNPNETGKKKVKRVTK